MFEEIIVKMNSNEFSFNAGIIPNDKSKLIFSSFVISTNVCGFWFQQWQEVVEISLTSDPVEFN